MPTENLNLPAQDKILKVKAHRRNKIEQYIRMEKYIQLRLLPCQVCDTLEGISIYKDWGRLYALCPIHKEPILKHKIIVEEYNIEPIILLFDPPLPPIPYFTDRISSLSKEGLEELYKRFGRANRARKIYGKTTQA